MCTAAGTAETTLTGDVLITATTAATGTDVITVTGTETMIAATGTTETMVAEIGTTGMTTVAITAGMTAHRKMTTAAVVMITAATLQPIYLPAVA